MEGGSKSSHKSSRALRAPMAPTLVLRTFENDAKNRVVEKQMTCLRKNKK